MGCCYRNDNKVLEWVHDRQSWCYRKWIHTFWLICPKALKLELRLAQHGPHRCLSLCHCDGKGVEWWNSIFTAAVRMMHDRAIKFSHPHPPPPRACRWPTRPAFEKFEGVLCNQWHASCSFKLHNDAVQLHFNALWRRFTPRARYCSAV